MARIRTKTSEQTLFSDYCYIDASSENRLSSLERLTMLSAGELTDFFKRIEGSQKAELDFSALISGLTTAGLQDASNTYQSIAQPFSMPRGVIAPRITPIHGLGDDGEIVDVEFESAYQPLSAGYEKVQATIIENSTVRMRLWRHTKEDVPTIMCVPGWTMGDHKVNASVFMPGFFYRLGFNVALFEIPFHGRRLTKEFRDIGHSVFPSANVSLTNEAVLQAVSDLRQSRLVLRALGLKNIGAFGISLGAYVASLWSTLEPLPFLINLLPLFSFSAIATAAAKRFGREDLTTELLDAAFSVHALKSRTSKVAAAHVKLFHMTGDPYIQTQDLAIAQSVFPGVSITEFEGSHEIQSSREQILTELVAFLSNYSKP